MVQPIIVVTGPTACGKSEFAVKLALARSLSGSSAKSGNFEIVNFDSVQIYKGVDIGSARLRPEEEKGVPHHLFGVLDPGEACHVARFAALVDSQVAQLLERGIVPVFVGGPSLYLTTLLHGLARLPAGSSGLRNSFQAQSSQDLYRQLQILDPDSARKISENDRVRIMRALETVMCAGAMASKSREEHSYRERRYAAQIWVLCRPREVLYERINRRSKEILAAGLLNETQAIANQYGPNAPVLRSIGFAQALRHLRGEIPESELVEEISMATRRLAKRQMTYLRNEPAKRGWEQIPDQAEISCEMPSNSRDRRGRAFAMKRCGLSAILDSVHNWLRQPSDANQMCYIDAFAAGI